MLWKVLAQCTGNGTGSHRNCFSPHFSAVFRPRPQGRVKELCYHVVCPLGSQCDSVLFVALTNAALCHERADWSDILPAERKWHNQF